MTRFESEQQRSLTSAGGQRVRVLTALCAATIGTMSTHSALSSEQHSGDRDDHERYTFLPGNLVLSRSVYDNRSSNVKVGTILPPGCAATTGGCAASTGAPFDGTYPFVWNNDGYDASFGITSQIFLDEITPTGGLRGSLEVPNSLQPGVAAASNQLVTSFSSKSELALNLSLHGDYLTFAGYVAPVDTLDVSNSNTPAATDLTNPVGQAFLRAVARVDAHGRFHFTTTNAYSGNNGRAAILNNAQEPEVIYAAGNAGNGANPQPDGVVLGAGAQFMTPTRLPEAAQTPGTPEPLASFSVTKLGAKADKIGKDDNFRGLTVFDDVLYYSKGSGSNGVNTVYFVDTSGSACPNGVGVPAAGATLPTTALPFDLGSLESSGLPSNMCILAGFPAVPNKSQTTVTAFPFGIWFADASTVYIADEGDGYTGGQDLYTHAAAQTTAGLQKWVFEASDGKWHYVYTLQTGLDLGVPYSVRGYPAGTNSGTGLPWSPSTDGLRNITGRVDEHGLVTIWAITSTVSGNGDTGADPNRLVVITDRRSNTDPAVAAKEQFVTLRTAPFAQVLRGIAFTPRTLRHEH
jgi:hypothetical protein